MKKIIALFLLAILILTFAACAGDTVESTDVVLAAQPAVVAEEETNTTLDARQTVNTQQTLAETAVPLVVEYANDDLDTSGSALDMTTIKLEGDSITFEGAGVTVNENIVTITSAGTYSISGTLNDGQIVVDTQDEQTVNLILDAVNISYATNAPIFMRNAEKTVITLADGAENIVTDGASYVFADAETDEPNAAIFSKDDLTINGSGSLTVNANYNNGIASKDDLKITGGSITVNAVNDGIKSRDSIAVLAGNIVVNAGGDGLQANNDEDVTKGYISIEGGTLTITAGLDGIQAETVLNVSDGNPNIISGGGSSHSVSDSAKGLKAGVDIAIAGGTITVDAADDAIHANGSVTINGGDIVVASADDGVHADTSLVINGSNLTITHSYEGLESSIIVINDGTIRLYASDDGVNVAGGENGGGGPGSVSGNYYLEINGGYLFVAADGDGLDSNGLGTMNGGVVIVNGPANNSNGSLDVDGSLVINGGFLTAVGSAGMAQTAGAASTQYSVLVTLPSIQAAGVLIHVESEDGQDILTFVPTKAYQTILVSSPDLTNGESYMVYTGGSATGTVYDGLYTDGTYTPGTQATSFTITSMVTGENAQMGGGPGGPRGNGRP